MVEFVDVEPADMEGWVYGEVSKAHTPESDCLGSNPDSSLDTFQAMCPWSEYLPFWALASSSLKWWRVI